ncbi:MAG: FHA domain-containing protein [Pseudomonadota bacterium]
MSDKTKWIWQNSPGAQGGGANPPIPGHDDDGDTTRALGQGGGTVSEPFSAPPEAPGGDSTILARREDAQVEPVCGWLVVVKGPGLGDCVRINAGMSPIGRGADQRISLDFGDSSISRSNHARIAYDAGSRSFFIMPGDGKNLSRVNGDLLLDTRKLLGGELIEFGDTHVRFVPFCGEGFDWADVETADPSE